MKNDKSIVVDSKTDLQKVRDTILKPDEQKRQRTVETLKSTFAKISIK